MSGTPLVAIDGPAGVGKSTLARALAARLTLPYVNTGLMYRAVALAALRRGVDPSDGAALGELAGAIRFDLSQGPEPRTLRIDGAEPEPDLASPGVERVVSEVSAHAPVRSVLRAQQRRLGVGGAVMEGRDIGSVVFPDATAKVFLRAPASVRASRRARERGDAHEPVAAALARRDARDARAIGLEPAPDAVLVDTTGKGADEVLAESLAAVLDRLGAGAGNEP